MEIQNKATSLWSNFFNVRMVQIRTFHMTWFAFFSCFFAWFGIAPLMIVVRDELGLTKSQVGWSIIASVAMTIVGRFFIGWLCDRIGPRLAYTWLLILGAFPVAGIGLANSFESFMFFRLLIGMIGAAFVITQYHTTVMFAPNVVGTANATSAGWGNLGGGVTQFAMPLVFSVFITLGFTDASSWRLSMVVVGCVIFVVGIVQVPLLHDTPGELAQDQVRDWKKGECDLIPGKTAPNYVPVERDYTAIYDRFVALGPLLDKLGNGGKGIMVDAKHEVQHLRELNGVHEDGPAKGQPKIVTDIDATEVVLMLAPETNGEVAVKAWDSLSKATGRDHTHLAKPKEDEKIRFRDIAAQPRKIISSPTWSGLESEDVCYNAGYTNVHELIPWRTLTGRQQTYQDHQWMLAFGEGFLSYRPPVDLKTITDEVHSEKDWPHVVLNFITPHQKWGIHSTYSDNLHMLTLNRGGPVIWISENDAKSAGIVDNDWVELYNSNGALTARAVVSQRMKDGTTFMYHAQEKIVNTPGSEKTGKRGGIHNSVTRATLKPTHMIGGYAQQSYGFNYYGTVGANRDEFVVVRKMKKVDWLDREATPNKEAAE